MRQRDETGKVIVVPQYGARGWFSPRTCARRQEEAREGTIEDRGEPSRRPPAFESSRLGLAFAVVDVPHVVFLVDGVGSPLS